MRTFTTKLGLELPLIDLKGKDYLLVAHRIQWWRSEHPFGRIDTEKLESTEKFVIYKATISIPNERGDYVKLADGVKREDFSHFSDANEKAQTGAVGRALAMCGYGTQFAPDFDEGDRLADAPIERHWTETEKKNYCFAKYGVESKESLTMQQRAEASKVALTMTFAEAMKGLKK
jgi:hypothetical protein